MMELLALLLIIEILNFLVLKERFGRFKPTVNVVIATINIVLSAWLWYTVIFSLVWKGPYDDPANIRMRLNMAGLLTAVAFPRALLIFLHYTGKAFRIRKGGYNLKFTDPGIVAAIFISVVIFTSIYHGRFNFKTEIINISVPASANFNTPLKILHVSDLHLASFDGHHRKLEKAVSVMNAHDPDIVINTGDFISYGWREFGRCDTILRKEKHRYGKYTVLGNHDLGTYLPLSDAGERAVVIEEVKKRIELSGYELLDNSNTIVDIRGARVAILGVTTGGRHPEIIYGDIDKAAAGTDSADIRILLAHDPNQWETDIKDKTRIELTLSGHTHGMQMGIITRKFRWSPAKYLFPHWNGLYGNNMQHHYVNRGLGTLSIPFRIWMPPEITVINLLPE